MSPIDGASITPPSHGWSAVSSAVAVPASDRPSGASGCTQSRAGTPQQLPSFFQYRNALPSSATNGLGSMAPPSSTGHTSGPADTSTYGPSALSLVASEMHCLPDAASVVV